MVRGSLREDHDANLTIDFAIDFAIQLEHPH